MPEPQTDFIFSIISEEFGFLGIIIVSILFILIIYRGFRISKHCEDRFGKFLAFGITFGISFQALLNLMVVVGSKKSANTTHLAQLLTAITKTIHIEDENELDNYKNIIINSQNIGVTAGASTPDNIIKEVINKLERTK